MILYPKKIVSPPSDKDDSTTQHLFHHEEDIPPSLPPSATVQKELTLDERKQLKITPPAYNQIKKKKLQELCRDQGLSTSGSEQELKHRHEEFVRLWNAECNDAKYPKSKGEILAAFKERENAKKNEARMSKLYASDETCMERLKASREAMGTSTTSAVMPTSGNDKFDKTMNDGFKDLIKNYRNGQKKSDKKTSGDSSMNTALEPTMPTCIRDMMPSTTDTATATNNSSESTKAKETSSTNSSTKRKMMELVKPPSSNFTSPSRKRKTKQMTFKKETLSNQSTRRPLTSTKSSSSEDSTWECVHCSYENKIESWSRTKPICKGCYIARGAPNIKKYDGGVINLC